MDFYLKNYRHDVYPVSLYHILKKLMRILSSLIPKKTIITEAISNTLRALWTELTA